MNKSFLSGNLTNDPELRTTPDGVDVCHFRIAVDRGRGGKNEQSSADFFNVTAFRQLAGLCVQYLKKGRKVSVVGHLRINAYEKGGSKHERTEIVADEIEFL